jgi:hypothetical protein
MTTKEKRVVHSFLVNASKFDVDSNYRYVPALSLAHVSHPHVLRYIGTHAGRSPPCSKFWSRGHDWQRACRRVSYTLSTTHTSHTSITPTTLSSLLLIALLFATHATHSPLKQLGRGAYGVVW